MGDSSKSVLNAIETQVQDHGTKGFWRINLRDGLQPGKSVVVSILFLNTFVQFKCWHIYGCLDLNLNF